MESQSQPPHSLSENTTGSSPGTSRNWSSQSSSHVFAYPSSNWTSRFWRMPIVAMRSSEFTPAQYNSSVIVGKIIPRIANGFPTQLVGPVRIGMRQKLSPNLQPIRLTIGEWNKSSSIVYEICLLYGTRELHRTLVNQPSLGPKLIAQGAKVSRVPMQCEDVDRYGRPLREVANTQRSAI